VTTLFLGSYGFGNLGDELCLIEAMRAFPSTEAWAFSNDAVATARHTGLKRFIARREEVSELHPQRVVLGGGGLGYWPSLRDNLHWMADAAALGAELHIHNIGISPIDHPDWLSDPVVRDTFAALSSFTVRDHTSQDIFASWGFDQQPGLSLYPEVDLPAEAFDLPELPAGRLVGFSFTSRPATLHAVTRNRDELRRTVNAIGDFTAIPIISTVHANAAAEDDIAGFRHFADEVLGDRPVALPQTLDAAWWSDNMGPLRLKYLISKLDLLVSERKHNVIHAIGSGVPFLGITPAADDSLARIAFSLADRRPAGSRLLPLS
jgi:hypothetical protein